MPPSRPAVHHKAVGPEEVLRTGSAARIVAGGEVDIQVGRRSPAEEDSYFQQEEELPSLAEEVERCIVPAAVAPILAEGAVVPIRLVVVRTSESGVCVVLLRGSSS